MNKEELLAAIPPNDPQATDDRAAAALVAAITKRLCCGTDREVRVEIDGDQIAKFVEYPTHYLYPKETIFCDLGTLEAIGELFAEKGYYVYMRDGASDHRLIVRTRDKDYGHVAPPRKIQKGEC